MSNSPVRASRLVGALDRTRVGRTADTVRAGVSWESPRTPGYPSAVPRIRIPDDVLSLAHDRAAARGAKDWAAADRIRAEIEAAGWKIVDRGTDFALEPIHPPTVADGDGIRYGSSDAVPSLLAAPDVAAATVVLVATDWPDDLARTLDGLRAHVPDGTSIVVVADGP